ncbi:phosphoinositide phospholipase C 7-like isoform X1 [Lycium ferocissimum]|uniref:phosphoinositide phospholipase C 7-like isoform X1 n=1 Tax=Lycium ferocissimum TaxID=112874 RepID=UPI00281649C7|nr:phosphoinositide phospholipase C 7-like isoform X1 [Lycium ferocissimum]
MSKQTYKVGFFFRRQFTMNVAEAPVDIKNIFNRYSGDDGVMSVDKLHRFMVEVQMDKNASFEDAQAIINNQTAFQLDAFFKYLFSHLNPPLDPKLGIHHDMTAPLSHYYIYTGHNSYLTGNQLSSDCSDVPIIQALQRGVRVIELDIWPNSDEDDIDVLHGRTLTAPVALIKCLRSIKEHAFSASEYPVVITLEDHLTPDLQEKVAEMITQTFGDMLFSPSECLKELPSPASLKKRVMISTKPPKEYLQSKAVKGKNDSKKEVEGKNGSKREAEGKDDSKKEAEGKNDSKKEAEGKNGSKKEAEGKDDSEKEAEGKDDSEKEAEGKDDSEKEAEGKDDSEKESEGKDDSEKEAQEDDSDEGEDDEGDPKSEKNAASEYKRLIAIHAGKGKGGLSDWLRVYPNIVRRLSLSEQELEKAVDTHGKEIIRFTQQNLLRIYPKGIRVDSSNYDPFVGWMHGAQMVAFNMQGYGRSLWLMHGMFRANGGCGYVKKPDLLLKAGPNNEVFDPTTNLPVKTTLKVTVYMGDGWDKDFDQTHFDKYSPPDFYAKVGIAGVPADEVKKKTKTMDDNWIPSWDEQFEFPLTVPELALLRIKVLDYNLSDKDEFAGQTCLPVAELRQGIRAVPLYDRKGEKYSSVKLLMRFEFV